MTEATQAPDPKAVYRALAENGTFATVLHAIALQRYGDDIYYVDSVELFLRLEEDFGTRLTEEHENKLNAMLTAVATDAFYEDKDAFVATCNTLSNGDPGLDLLDDLTVCEVFWALYEMEVNRDPENLSAAIQELIEQTILDEADEPDEATALTSYVFNFLNECRAKLIEQMQELGFDASGLPPVEPPTRISAEVAELAAV